jgi:hypothetical protein
VEKRPVHLSMRTTELGQQPVDLGVIGRESKRLFQLEFGNFATPHEPSASAKLDAIAGILRLGIYALLKLR